MLLELIIAIIIVRYLRTVLHKEEKIPKWDKILVYIMYAAIGLMVVGLGISALKPVAVWLSHALVLYLVYILYTEKDFAQARPVLLAVAPFIILSVFSDIINLTDYKAYSALKSLVSTGIAFSFVWMVAMWFITNKQKKDLEKEKIKTKVQEEQKTRMVSLKEQLEMQVAQRTAELTKQKEALEHTLEELKAAQTQLIQSEKMASLGELTAGIAHEIQNPLNFVNNFSEVNTELIEEMRQEIDNNNFEEVKAIAKDIKENEEKINHHGKRADAIVKGMLQHSRKSTGQKELTNINELTDEYLRLSYHGLRAKEKSFNATLKTSFDESIEKINIIPQDIGRVLLNIFNNSFYAVAEKKKEAGTNYEPTVCVTTKKINDKVEIRIKDNGNGIPQKVIDKIFQPFFTTKPTGQGTGLGLSMSFDIINKGHNGDMKVDTKDGEFAEFIITLPM